MVSTRSLISKSFSPWTNLSVTVLSTGFLGCYLDYFHTISQEIRNWFRPNSHYASAMGRGGRCRSQMTHLLTWLPSWIFMVKASQLSLPHFIGEHLMQQVGCSEVPGWHAQHICMSDVYSPIYSSSKCNVYLLATCVSDHSQVNQYSSFFHVVF